MRLPEQVGNLRYRSMMDDFDETVETVEEGSRGSKMGLVAVIIGVVGIIVGVTGIVLANQAQTKVRAIEAKLASQPDKTPELQKSVADVNDRLEKLGTEFVKLGRADRQIQDNTQAAFNEVTGSIKANRDALNELSGKMTELVGKLENWQPSGRVARTTTASSSPATADTSTDGESEAPGAEPALDEDVYVIQSGDTLSGVAKRFGVSLSALQAANPTVNPRALQIGQRIVIPGN